MLEASFLIIETSTESNEYKMILMQFNQESATKLYDQCHKLWTSSDQTFGIFEFFYGNFIQLRTEDTDHVTLINDGSEATSRLDQCIKIIESDDISLEHCFPACKTLIDAYRTYYKHFGTYSSQMSIAAGGKNIWIETHPLFPGFKYNIQSEGTHFLVETNDRIVHNWPHSSVCKSKLALFYCICASMEYLKEESFVCISLKTKFGLDDLPEFTFDKGTQTYTRTIETEAIVDPRR